MALKNFNPTTPGQRGLVLVDRARLWKGKPVKKLTEGLRETGGRDAGQYVQPGKQRPQIHRLHLTRLGKQHMGIHSANIKISANTKPASTVPAIEFRGFIQSVSRG